MAVSHGSALTESMSALAHFADSGRTSSEVREVPGRDISDRPPRGPMPVDVTCDPGTGVSLRRLGSIFLARFVVAMFELKAPPVAFRETSRTGAYNSPVRPGHPLSICVSWSSSRG